MTCDLAVVGGGISGLLLASQAARRGLQVQLWEADPAPGGCIRTHTFPEADGFWLELGAHTLFNSYGRLVDAIRATGLEEAVLPRRRVPFLLWEEGRAVSPIRRISLVGVAANLWRLPFLRREGSRVRDYYGKLVGARNFEAVIGPALDAVACQPTADFPADLLFKPKPRRRDMPRSFTLAGGLGRLVKALADTPRLTVATGQRATGLARTSDGFRLEGGEASLMTPRVALAAPVAKTVELLAPAFPDIAAPLSQIGTAPIETLGVVLDAASVRLPPLAGLIGRGQPFYSAVSRDVVPDPRYRGFAFHFRPGGLDARAKREVAAQVLGVAPERLLAYVENRASLPAPRPGYAQALETLERARGTLPLALAGNGFEGLSLEDCAARSEKELDRLLAISI